MTSQAHLRDLLAHEIGHYKRGHIPKRLVTGALLQLGAFALIGEHADIEAGKAVLGDRRVDYALGAEFLQQVLAYLVGALILQIGRAHV